MLPRLWPYLDHSTSSVRKATLQTLRTITRPLITTPTPNGQTNGDNDHQTENENSDKENTDSEKCKNASDNKNEIVNGETEQFLNWTPELLQEAMRHIYQRVLFEHVHDIQEIAVQVKYFFLCLIIYLYK